MRDILIRTAKDPKDVNYLMTLAFEEMDLEDPDFPLKKELVDELWHPGTYFTAGEKWRLVKLGYASRMVDNKILKENYEKCKKLDPESEKLNKEFI